MAVEKVVYIKDHERQREPDAQAVQRDPAQAGATIIILPVVRVERPDARMLGGRLVYDTFART